MVESGDPLGPTTRIPRWSAAVSGGTEPLIETIDLPADLVVATAGCARQLGVTVDTVLLAVHAAVLARLAGERRIVTGYRGSGDRVRRTCQIDVVDGTWRELVAQVSSARFAVAGGAPDVVLEVDELPTEVGQGRPGGAGRGAPVGGRGATGSAPAFVATFQWGGDQARLRLTCRPDAVDSAYAARIAGYYRTVLSTLTADPEAGQPRPAPLSAAETEYLLDGLAGPCLDVPDRRFHELFEERARQRPELVAAVHEGRSLTYGELNRRANRIARVLLANGTRREDVVAVVTDRNLDWMTAVIAIFKAGAVYLPIEPNFPPERITRVIERSGCRLALTEPGQSTNLDGAVAAGLAVSVLHLSDGYRSDHPDTDLGLAVTPDQLAYIYFTSGSTGEPKGAMCEHAGMINHLLAKINDLGIRPGDAVAQTAPQCFDISLWQLISALLVGGRTIIVSQDAILDVERYLDTIIDNNVRILQAVPSYLDAVLSNLDRRPRFLGQLRCVSVTGEALRPDLVERWFARFPAINLVNAYGLTETSDDTNHEVLTRPLPDGRVPLGPAVQNVYIYLLDEHLELVPLGAVGEICFSGVCVGRGYINDPERTRAAFLDDPHRPGNRMYRSGDFGRWAPDGKLEFLGRRDAQVKIRGFRVEIGEVEGQLLKVPGVTGAAVVVVESNAADKYLAGFYQADGPLPAATVEQQLRAALPEYAVPTRLRQLDELPLTENGKTNKKELTRLAAEATSEPDATVHVPVTPTEQLLAAAWSEVLRLPADRVGRADNFFELGGTSLSAVRMIVKLDRLFTIRQLADHPVLAELARFVDGAGPPAGRSAAPVRPRELMAATDSN